MNELTTMTYYNSVLWIAGVFALLSLFKWLYPILCKLHDLIFKKLGVKTKRMMKREDDEQRLKKVEKAIEEIKDTSKHNVDMFLDHERQVVEKFTDIKNEIVTELGKLHKKIDEQQRQLETIDKEGKKRDCAVLRDRILSGMRYFGQNKDEQGRVHITQSDFENMNAMFTEYFGANGNGAVKIIYNEEFLHYIIDR